MSRGSRTRASDALSEAMQRVAYLVRIRMAGMGVAEAVRVTARDLGLTSRRVRGLLYQEARDLYAREYLAIQERYDELVELEAARLEARAVLLRARRINPRAEDQAS